MGYGQHQSFYLRINWLRKALKHLQEGKVFNKVEAPEQLGLGKNMVQSLRYWVEATEVVRIEKATLHISDFGQLLNRYDRFIELRDTASIIHLHLTDNKEPSTTWYWYFNHCIRKVATKEELLTDLISWIAQNDVKKPSESSLKRDIDCLVRLYCDKERPEDPEEVIQSPLNILGLVAEENKNVIKRSPRYSDIGTGALLYSLLRYKAVHGISVLSVDEIEKKESLWGKVYNLQRNEIIKALEELTVHPYHKIRFDRTNRLDTIHLPDVSAMRFLEDEYKRNGRKTYVDSNSIFTS
ncbi:DUF4007 family protein [Paenibacillus lemnae]|uniref:DUF4007 family protein n=1 Tax=Paenibacillus lemnae TaxID=1330551 RepID=A0A848M3X8_PAELE|nr:DUF4007 family protein [Paenibacillus lemnae]NMO94920.1 DUF4007 family protein [Paenibacillus lemnae]